MKSILPKKTLEPIGMGKALAPSSILRYALERSTTRGG